MRSTDLYRQSTRGRHPAAAAIVASMLFASASDALAACPAPSSLTDFEAVMGEAEAALSRLDVGTFKALIEGAETMLPCLDKPVPTRLAANYHRVYGIRAYGNRDPIAARAFAAARHLEPAYQFSKSLLPEGNPIRTEYEKTAYTERATEPLDRPETGAIYVDGVPSAERPISWPAVVQWVDGTDAVRFTDYLLPGEALPQYPVYVPPEIPDPKPPGGLIAATVVAGLGSGALYGVALAQEARYKDTENNPVPDENLDSLRRTTNTLVIASAVTATAAVGMGVTVVVAW